MNSGLPLHKRLKRFREQRKLTMRETAKLIGIPETTYREWEYGRSIRGEPYLKIAEAFGVSLEDLLGSPKRGSELIEGDINSLIRELSEFKIKVVKLRKTSR
jgi:transcriptional regulator with XRE-family HTH domain